MGNETENYSGGYGKLKTYQLTQLIYDITVHFVEQYIELGSRTRDQMVQAARSSTQNIVEGSLASAESKKTELKLTSVARASLGELMADYQDYLRQRGANKWTKDSQLYKDFISLRVKEKEQFKGFVNKAIDTFASQKRGNVEKQVLCRDDFCSSEKIPLRAWIICNGVLLLIRSADYLLMKQIDYLRKNGRWGKGGY